MAVTTIARQTIIRLRLFSSLQISNFCRKPTISRKIAATISYPFSQSASSSVVVFPYVYGDRVIFQHGCKRGDQSDWVPPIRVSSLYETVRDTKGGSLDHCFVCMYLMGVEFETEQQLFDYYIKILAYAVGSEDEAKKKIYLVSCGWMYGFGAELNYEERCKIKEHPEVWVVYIDYNYNTRNNDHNVQRAISFTPLNLNRRLYNIFSYYHLSDMNSNWNSDHWLITMNEPDHDNLTDFCIKLLAKVVGSEEEAMGKIYAIWCNLPFGFGAEIDEETAHKLRGLTNIRKVLPDYAFDIKDRRRGALYIFPSSHGLKYSRYIQTGEYKSTTGLLSMEHNIGESVYSAYSSTVQSASQCVRNHVLNDIFSYHHLAEYNLEWDSDHWLIHIKQPNEEFSTEQQIVDSCVQILSDVIGSDEDAKMKIYVVWCKEPFGFGAEIDMVTSNKLKGLPDVLTVLPDYAFDVKDKNRGAALVVSSSTCVKPGKRKIEYHYFPDPHDECEDPYESE